MAKGTGIAGDSGRPCDQGGRAGRPARAGTHGGHGAVLFEGDTHSQFRLVRAIKNRFGAVNEIGVFAMTEKGPQGVSNPSAIF